MDSLKNTIIIIDIIINKFIEFKNIIKQSNRPAIHDTKN